MKKVFVVLLAMGFLAGSFLTNVKVARAEEMVQDESFLPDELVNQLADDNSVIDPSVFIGKWGGTFTGGKSLSASGKATFRQSLYFNFETFEVFDMGYGPEAQALGNVFSDKAQLPKQKIGDAYLYTRQLAGNREIHILVLTDINFTLWYKLDGFYFPGIKKKPATMDLLLVKYEGELIDNETLTEKISWGEGIITKYGP